MKKDKLLKLITEVIDEYQAKQELDRNLKRYLQYDDSDPETVEFIKRFIDMRKKKIEDPEIKKVSMGPKQNPINFTYTFRGKQFNIKGFQNQKGPMGLNYMVRKVNPLQEYGLDRNAAGTVYDEFTKLADGYMWAAVPITDLKGFVKDPDQQTQFYARMTELFKQMSESEKKLAYEYAKGVSAKQHDGSHAYIPQSFVLFKRFFQDTSAESMYYDNFIDLLNGHDYYYEMADDFGSYTTGSRQIAEMKKLWSKLTPKEKLDAYEEYKAKFADQIAKKNDPWRIGTNNYKLFAAHLGEK